MSFAPLLDDSFAALGGLPGHPVALPGGYAKARRDEKQGVLELVNRFRRVGEWGEARGVLIAAPKIHIANLFFFPAPEWDLPLYVMNFVVLGPRPLAAVLDAACLLPGMAAAPGLAEGWRSMRARHGHIPQAEDMPDWYRECRSGHDFFVRPRDEAMLNELSAIHLGLWRDFLAGLPEAGRLSADRASAHRARLRDYKDHHRDNSPGLPLLRRSFGEAWTRRYLADVLFA